LEKDLLLYTG